MSWYSFCIEKLDFNLIRTLVGQPLGMCTLFKWFFLLFLYQQRNPFGLWVVPLAISSKILLCDNSEIVAWSKELKYH